MAKKKSGSGSGDSTTPGRVFYLILGALVVAGGVGLLMARGGGDSGGSAPEPLPVSASAAEADPEAGVALGPQDAPATVKEFVDYQCPHCAQFAGLAGKMLRRNFVRTDSARWVLYDFPLGNFPNSIPAAVAARCAGDQGAYWQMEELLFARQQEWGQEGNPRGKLVGYAERLGLDTDRFRTCLEERRHLDEIMASKRYGESLGVRGTPTLFVNGQRVQTSYQAVARQIREAWSRAEAGGAGASTSPGGEPSGR